MLRTNYDNYEQFSVNSSCDDKKSFTSFDIRQAAINAEYEIFSSNKVVTTYRRKMAFSMAEIKKKTDAWELHSILTNFDPDKLNDSIISNPTKSEKTIPEVNTGFQTALEMSKRKDAENTMGKTTPDTKDIASYFNTYDEKKNVKAENCENILDKSCDTGYSSFSTILSSANKTERIELSDVDINCKMKEPNKSKDKDPKSKLSKNEVVDTIIDSKDTCHPRSKEEKEKVVDDVEIKEDSMNDEETELSKALRRIKELEESNRQLAQKRISELEKENKKLSHSDSKENQKHKHRGDERHKSKERRDSMDHKSKHHNEKQIYTDSSRKRKSSTASSSSSIKSPPFSRSDSVQSKLKLLGLSDCNESSENDEEEQQNAFQDLFGLEKRSSSTKKSSKDKPKKKSKMCDNNSESVKSGSSKGKELSPILTKERDSSSSPNLSDLEERIKVEEEVMQIVAHELESEKVDLVSKTETSEHDELAAWLGILITN